jgi:hypothetical protein
VQRETPAPLPLLRDEKRRLEVRIRALERQRKEVKEEFLEVHNAQMTKTKATSTARRGKNNILGEQREAGSPKERPIAAATAND